ncbi:AAA family ATPase (plasmid) [Flammeovirgaceae bacterium SG7u.111]|nr:AAA family ATPase [Flammeovirgaceae bacterium SG7u.132]WPO38809.1 AAA family ATPase [Flammeovirgaceae bacterium SG7u.111]
MDIFYIVKLLYRRRILWIGVPLITGVIAFFFTLNLERTYRSSAQLATGYTITDQVKLNEERFNLYEINVKFDNLIETINSPMVIGLLSYRLLIHDLKTEKSFRELTPKKKAENKVLAGKNFKVLADTIERKLQNMEMLSLFSEDDKVLLELMEAYGYGSRSLRKMLRVSRVRYTDYVSITSFSDNPELSAFLVNTLCEEFLRYYNSLRTQRSSESVKTFAQLVEQKKKELDLKSEALREFKASSQVFDINLESTSKIERIKELETTLEEEKKNLRGLEYSLKSVNARLESFGSGSDILGSDQNSEIIEIRNRINVLNERYILEGSQNSTLRDSIVVLRRELQKKITSTDTSSEGSDMSADELKNRRRELETQIAIARQDVQEVESNLRAMRSTFGTYASKEARIATLERDVTLASEDYLNAQNKYNESLDVLLATTSSIKQVLYGQPPQEPEPSKRLMTVALSGATSFVLCILGILLLDFIDTSIKTPSYFGKSVPLKLIAVINRLNIKKTQGFEDVFSKSLEGQNQSMALFVESVRKLRYEIEATDKKVILFVSSRKGEGKTSLVHSLAYMFSRSRKKVLVVDTNFSNNDLTVALGAKPVLETMMEKGDIQAMKKGIIASIIKGIDVLGCEGGNYSPSEVFPDNVFGEGIKELKKEYDYILLEAAPISDYSDAKELIDSVEGVIGIFSSRTSIRQSDKETISFLSKLDIDKKLIGVVLNSVEKENLEH